MIGVAAQIRVQFIACNEDTIIRRLLNPPANKHAAHAGSITMLHSGTDILAQTGGRS